MINEYRFLVDTKNHLHVVCPEDVKTLLRSHGHNESFIRQWFQNYIVSGHNLNLCVLRPYKRHLELEYDQRMLLKLISTHNSEYKLVMFDNVCTCSECREVLNQSYER